MNEMKNHFKTVKNRREDFLHYFKVNFGEHFSLNKIDLDNQKNPITTLDQGQSEAGLKCTKCSSGEFVCKTSKKGLLYLGCNTFPDCDAAYFFSPKIRQFQELEDNCEVCQSRMVSLNSSGHDIPQQFGHGGAQDVLRACVVSEHDPQLHKGTVKRVIKKHIWPKGQLQLPTESAK